MDLSMIDWVIIIVFMALSLWIGVKYKTSAEKYVAADLWPFFASRIPSKKQPQVEKYINENPEESNNLAALLGQFAKRSVNNPFTLRML